MSEIPLCRELNQILGGTTEVRTPVGRLDLLTDNLIIEAKKASKAKHAIGQLLCYEIYHPRPNRAIALIGYPPKWAPEVCEKWNIILLYYCLNSYRWFLYE